jgi:hypothetical protein
MPLIFELPACDCKPGDCANLIYFSFVEFISAANGLRVNPSKVSTNALTWICRPQKSCELGMMHVAARSTGEHCLGKQSFTPQCHQALCVKVFRVQRPETHLNSSVWRSFDCPNNRERSTAGSRKLKPSERPSQIAMMSRQRPAAFEFGLFSTI